MSKFDNWKNAIEAFNKNEKKSFHRNSVFDADNFLAVLDSKTNPIDHDLDHRLREQIARNRKNLTPVIITVVWCGRQGVALRSHRDGGQIDLSSEPAENEINFKALA